MTREIYVFGDWQELGGSNLGGPQLMGLLRAEIVHGKETFSFEYDPQWLSGANAMLLDPELQFFPGPQYSSDNDRSNFGMFLDSSPDRWGQLLMRRREASEARVAGRRTKSLVGSDFLLGVHDEHGAATESDMHELWRRIVFSICVSNTDDHLRNHGFLLLPDGWKLSPAYAINLDPTGTGLSLNVSDVDNSLNLELALEVAEYFRLDNSEAGSIMNAIKQTVVRWPDIADQVGIPRGEQEMMRPAFRAVEG